MKITITTYELSKFMTVEWPGKHKHHFSLGKDQTDHWVLNSLANWLNATYSPAPGPGEGNRFNCIVALATHLWGTDLFSSDSVVDALLITNRQFAKPLPDAEVYAISKEICK